MIIVLIVLQQVSWSSELTHSLTTGILEFTEDVLFLLAFNIRSRGWHKCLHAQILALSLNILSEA